MLVLASTSANSSPFRSTDQNPLLGGGLSFVAPGRLAPSKTTSAKISLNWSSTAAIQQSGTETLIVDAESREWRLELEHAFSERLSLRVQLPYRSTTGGSLDNTIDRWHDVFGLPNGDRLALAQNQLLIDYRRGNSTLVNYRNQNVSSLGNASIDVGLQLRANESSATSVWSSVAFPTGDSEKLSGGDAFSATVVLAHTKKIADRFELFGHTGVLLSGSQEPLEEQRKSAVWLAMIGAEFRATTHLTLTLQLDGHSAAFERTGESADLDLLGPAYILTAGGEYIFPKEWRLTVGFAEDVKVEASPDVSFLLAVKKNY